MITRNTSALSHPILTPRFRSHGTWPYPQPWPRPLHLVGLCPSYCRRQFKSLEYSLFCNSDQTQLEHYGLEYCSFVKILLPKTTSDFTTDAMCASLILILIVLSYVKPWMGWPWLSIVHLLSILSTLLMRSEVDLSLPLHTKVPVCTQVFNRK